MKVVTQTDGRFSRVWDARTVFASSLRNRPIAEATAVFGEIGLAGEIRGIPQAGLRVKEASQLGFRRCVVPRANLDPDDKPLGDGSCELVPVTSVSEALDVLLV